MQELQPKGDYGLNFRETLPYFNQEQLAHELHRFEDEGNIYQVVSSKLEQLSEISTKLFSSRLMSPSK